MCTSGRPGPVLIDIPMNIQKAEINPLNLTTFNSIDNNLYNLEKVKSQIHQYASDLVKAERPVMMIGGGVKNANAIDDFRELG